MSTKCLNCERRLPMDGSDCCEPCLAMPTLKEITIMPNEIKRLAPIPASKEITPVLVEVKPRRHKPPRLAKRDWQAPIDWNRGDSK